MRPVSLQCLVISRCLLGSLLGQMPAEIPSRPVDPCGCEQQLAGIQVSGLCWPYCGSGERNEQNRDSYVYHRLYGPHNLSSDK